MDAGKEELFLNRRISKSAQVKIVFTGNYDFIVVDDEGNQKYNGCLVGKEPSQFDFCRCKSFENGNASKTEGDYITTHGFSFQCKHIIAARKQKYPEPHLGKKVA